MLVGITGHKQAGKSTIGNFLAEHYGFETIGFADPVKEMALAIDPLIPTDGECILGYYPRLRDVVELYGEDAAKGLFPEVRRLYQRIGTEAGREVLGENVWVDALFHRIRESEQHNWAVTDVRFVNEAKAIRSRGGKVFKVTRPGYDGDNHASEREVDAIVADVFAPNDGTLADLEKRITSPAIEDLLFPTIYSAYEEAFGEAYRLAMERRAA